MDAFELSDLIEQHKQSSKLYHEFLSIPSMSLGLYALPAGGSDPQKPHNEDEVYYVLSGRGSIRVGSEDREVQAGSIVFVAAHVEHRFHSIKEDLNLLVFFAPVEGSSG